MPSPLEKTRAHGRKRHGYPANRSPVGRWVDFSITETAEGAFLFDWELDINPGYEDGYAIFVFSNGTFLRRITGNSWEWNFTSEGDGVDRWNFDLVLAASVDRGESNPFVRELNLQNRIKMDWSLPSGPVAKVEIYKNALNDSEVDTDVPIKSFHRPIIEVDDSNVSVSGRWQGIDEVEQIVCTVATTGTPGTAQLAWTYKTESGTMPIETRAQELFNGVRIAFADRTWTEGESFNINIQFPTSYTSGKVGNGSHTFQIGTYNGGNQRTLSSEMPSISVVNVPASPDLISQVYLGSGDAQILWRMPSDPDLKTARIYRNYPSANVQTIHSRPIHEVEVSPSEVLRFPAGNLEPGLNRFVCRCQNGVERETNLKYVEFLLDDSLTEIKNPNPPYSVSAVLESDNTITATIIADSSSDTLNLYHDSGTGVIDYSTVWATTSNPQLGGRQTITIPSLYLADGSYTIAARAKTGTVIEENVSVLSTINIDTSTPPLAHTLVLELV